MSERVARARREPAAVVMLGGIVGAVLALPAAAVALPALDMVEAWAGGADAGQAWAAVTWTDEDLELLPGLVVGAIVLGAFAGVASSVVWLLVTRRAYGHEGDAPDGRKYGRSSVARVVGSLAAAAVPLVILGVSNWPLALTAAVPAAIVAFAAEPWVGVERVRSAHTPEGEAPLVSEVHL